MFPLSSVCLSVCLSVCFVWLGQVTWVGQFVRPSVSIHMLFHGRSVCLSVSSDVDVVREESSDIKPDDDRDIMLIQARPAIAASAAAAAADDGDKDDDGGDDDDAAAETVSTVSHKL